MALDLGRFAAAEGALKPLLRRRDEMGERAAKLADQLDLFTGRSREIGPRIERRWATTSEPLALLRLHWQLETQPIPLEKLHEGLDRAAREAPDDDRVWLGRADLALRERRLDEADALLKQCESRRPDDPDVRRARLDWALAAGRPEIAVEATRGLPPSSIDPADRAAILARIAQLRNDHTGEARALEELVKRRPGDSSAWSRLADHAARDGRRDRAAELRRHKADVDRILDHYRMLMGGLGAYEPSNLDDFARTAEALGRRFEARSWWTMRLRRVPDDREARSAIDRLGPEPDAIPVGIRSLADLIPPPPAVRSRSSAITIDSARVPTFRDLAESAGLRFTYRNDATPMCRLPETMGSGVAVLDFDGDGWLDVYCVQGGTLPDRDPPPPAPQGDRLFRNRRDGAFEDVTAASGLAAMPGGYGHGATVGDYDNDGHPDLFVARWRSYALYHNRGDGTFEDATDRAGLGGPRDWPTSSAFADLDNDGDLDLYVCHYAAWDPIHSLPCPHPNDPKRHGYCVPRSVAAMPDHVFRNDGGRFVDVSESSGVRAGDPDGRGLGVVAAQLDDDDRVDLFVADDMTANLLFFNLGGFRFREGAAEAGVATNASGGYLAGMGVACGDADGDGRADLVVTNFYGESSTFYRNLGGGMFADQSTAVDLAGPTRHVLGFGASFLDADNDGRLDIVQANGHVNDYRPWFPYAMPAQLFLGSRDGQFAEVSSRAGACWGVARVGRGLAVADLDNDGREDVVIASSGGPVAYFHNDGPAGHFLVLELQGDGAKSNRDAVGARVVLRTGDRRSYAQRIGGGSFLSAGDPRIHFGLGDEARVDEVEVRWPSGRVDLYKGLAADRAYRLREGQSKGVPLNGRDR